MSPAEERRVQLWIWTKEKNDRSLNSVKEKEIIAECPIKKTSHRSKALMKKKKYLFTNTIKRIIFGSVYAI